MEKAPVNDVINKLGRFTISELLAINKEISVHLKLLRYRLTLEKKSLFSVGDRVQWTGRLGHTEGVIVRVKRTKVLVSVNGNHWDIPLTMLEKASNKKADNKRKRTQTAKIEYSNKKKKVLDITLDVDSDVDSA